MVSSSTIIYSLNEPLFLLCVFDSEEWEGYLREAQKKKRKKTPKKERKNPCADRIIFR